MKNLQSYLSTITTRPADTTAYASGDLVANNVTAGSVVPFNLPVVPKIPTTNEEREFRIRRVKIRKSGTGVTNAAFRVHFYRVAPTVTNGDNGAWLSIEADYLGSVDVTVDKAFSTGAIGHGSQAENAEIIGLTPLNERRIYALLEARGAYTPASAETFQITVDADQP